MAEVVADDVPMRLLPDEEAEVVIVLPEGALVALAGVTLSGEWGLGQVIALAQSGPASRRAVEASGWLPLDALLLDGDTDGLLLYSDEGERLPDPTPTATPEAEEESPATATPAVEPSEPFTATLDAVTAITPTLPSLASPLPGVAAPAADADALRLFLEPGSLADGQLTGRTEDGETVVLDLNLYGAMSLRPLIEIWSGLLGDPQGEWLPAPVDALVLAQSIDVIMPLMPSVPITDSVTDPVTDPVTGPEQPPVSAEESPQESPQNGDQNGDQNDDAATGPEALPEEGERPEPVPPADPGGTGEETQNGDEPEVNGPGSEETEAPDLTASPPQEETPAGQDASEEGAGQEQDQGQEPASPDAPQAEPEGAEDAPVPGLPEQPERPELLPIPAAIRIVTLHTTQPELRQVAAQVEPLVEEAVILLRLAQDPGIYSLDAAGGLTQIGQSATQPLFTGDGLLLLPAQDGSLLHTPLRAEAEPPVLPWRLLPRPFHTFDPPVTDGEGSLWWLERPTLPLAQVTLWRYQAGEIGWLFSGAAGLLPQDQLLAARQSAQGMTLLVADSLGDFYAVHMDGKTVRRGLAVPAAQVAGQPLLSPDGAHLAYISAGLDSGLGDGLGEIVVRDLAEEEEEGLPPVVASHPLTLDGHPHHLAWQDAQRLLWAVAWMAEAQGNAGAQNGVATEGTEDSATEVAEDAVEEDAANGIEAEAEREGMRQPDHILAWAWTEEAAARPLFLLEEGMTVQAIQPCADGSAWALLTQTGEEGSDSLLLPLGSDAGDPLPVSGEVTAILGCSGWLPSGE